MNGEERLSGRESTRDQHESKMKAKKFAFFRVHSRRNLLLRTVKIDARLYSYRNAITGSKRAALTAG
jgi:hypothetical protein